MKKETNLETLRHSASHVLAAAVLEMFPEAKFGIGPAVENGFYYDFELPRTLIPEDLPILEEKMQAIIKANHKFEREEISATDAIEHFEKLGQKYKVELIKDLPKDSPISVYKTNGFVDLCAGPHLESTGEISADAFKLTRISGAYWKSDEKREQLQRIYGVAFENKKGLDEYLKMIKEAGNRDHKKLGKELGLFVFSELVGPGLPLYTPKGTIIRSEIQNYSNKLRKAIGYQEVHTPQINKALLFKKSGHYEKYKDNMFRVVSNYSKEEYFLKPMSCPQHTQIFSSVMRSYKDLPIRIADYANLYRDEKPGQLGGLTRLRSFSQDDGHCFCSEDQISLEFMALLLQIKEAMKTYGMEYYIRLSLRDEKKKGEFMGSDETWTKSQLTLENLLKENNVKYEKAEGEAAFYGPKMDLIAKDSIGREWQLSTIQLDFNMPERFGLEYVGADGKKHTPVMIHSAIVGSPERFMGILIEHYAGIFPLWLSPAQVVVIPVSDKDIKVKLHAIDIKHRMIENGIRALIIDELQSGYTKHVEKKENRRETIDIKERLGKMISEAEKQNIPYIVVVGEKEAAEDLVAIRERGTKEQETLKISEFIEKLSSEIKAKK